MDRSWITTFGLFVCFAHTVTAEITIKIKDTALHPIDCSPDVIDVVSGYYGNQVCQSSTATSTFTDLCDGLQSCSVRKRFFARCGGQKSRDLTLRLKYECVAAPTTATETTAETTPEVATEPVTEPPTTTTPPPTTTELEVPETTTTTPPPPSTTTEEEVDPDTTTSTTVTPSTKGQEESTAIVDTTSSDDDNSTESIDSESTAPTPTFDPEDDCATVNCQHGGTCVDDFASFICKCAKGYAGRYCEKTDTTSAGDKAFVFSWLLVVTVLLHKYAWC